MKIQIPESGIIKKQELAIYKDVCIIYGYNNSGKTSVLKVINQEFYKNTKKCFLKGENKAPAVYIPTNRIVVSARKTEDVTRVPIVVSGKGEKLELCVNGEIIEAYTVKDFYNKIFSYLIKHNIQFETMIPYATGRKRYLINYENEHIYGNPFVSPIMIENYYIETHKSKSGAIRDIYKFLKDVHVSVEYIK